MSNVLIRGLPEVARRKIEKFAHARNLSINQTMILLIVHGLKESENEKAEEARREEAFQRLYAMRERMHRKYGRVEDSTKIIREFRDKRNQ